MGHEPIAHKDEEDTTAALQQMTGPKLHRPGLQRRIRRKAARLQTARPQAPGGNMGRPQTNGVIESAIRPVLEGERTLLTHAGLDS